MMNRLPEDGVRPDEGQDPEGRKPAWSRPTLTVFGRVAELTTLGLGGGNDFSTLHS